MKKISETEASSKADIVKKSNSDCGKRVSWELLNSGVGASLRHGPLVGCGTQVQDSGVVMKRLVLLFVRTSPRAGPTLPWQDTKAQVQQSGHLSGFTSTHSLPYSAMFLPEQRSGDQKQ